MANLKYYNTETSQWETLVVGAKGETGEQGATGLTGPQGPAGLGTIAVTAPITNAGTSTDAVVGIDLSDIAPKENPTFTGTVTAPVIRLTTTSDVTLTSTAHAFQIGPSTGDNLAIDDNEIMARTNGAVSDLNLNFNGGDVVIGNSTSNTILSGRMTATHYPWAVSAGSGTIAAPTALNTIQTTSVTFPTGRFTQAPIVVANMNTTNTNQRIIRVSGVTTTGFTIGQWQTTGATLQSTGFYYTATQMTSSAASG